MGINSHYYTVYGVYMDWDNDFNEEYDEVYKAVDQAGVDVVQDGMAGEYIVVGKILFNSGDMRWSEIKDTFVRIDMDGLEDMKVQVMMELLELMPKNSYKLATANWQIMTFLHLS